MTGVQTCALPICLVSEVISLYRDRGSLYEKMDKEPSANGVDNVLKEIYAVAERR